MARKFIFHFLSDQKAELCYFQHYSNKHSTLFYTHRFKNRSTLSNAYFSHLVYQQESQSATRRIPTEYQYSSNLYCIGLENLTFHFQELIFNFFTVLKQTLKAPRDKQFDLFLHITERIEIKFGSKNNSLTAQEQTRIG